MVLIKCDVCNLEFKKKPHRVGKTNYCSNECMYLGRERIAHERVVRVTGNDIEGWLRREYTENLRSVRDIAREIYGVEKNSSAVLNLLNKYGIERRTGSDAIKTQWINNDERRALSSKTMKKTMTPQLREKIKAKMQTDEYREKQRISKTGERNGMHGVFGADHPQWNPERTHDQRVTERKTHEYKDWRRNVFVRDNYRCRLCGDKRGRNLVVHHLNSYHENEAGRYDTENGLTLCKVCHLEYHHGYGWKNATRKKFEQFMECREAQTA